MHTHVAVWHFLSCYVQKLLCSELLETFGQRLPGYVILQLIACVAVAVGKVALSTLSGSYQDQDNGASIAAH